LEHLYRIAQEFDDLTFRPLNTITADDGLAGGVNDARGKAKRPKAESKTKKARGKRQQGSRQQGESERRSQASCDFDL
jgi:hypothetical protein